LNADRLISAAQSMVDVALGWVLAYPWVLVIGVLLVAVFGAANHQGGSPQRDPQRLFTTEQKKTIHTRAGHRCEETVMPLRRCRATSTHADHIFPWSKGGATCLDNGQALCARHNRAKSARVPSRFYVLRLESRRRKYFPSEQQVRVAWRLNTGL